MSGGIEYDNDQQRPDIQIHDGPYIDPLEYAFNCCKPDRHKERLPAKKDRVYDEKKGCDLYIWQQIKRELGGLQYCKRNTQICNISGR